MADHYKKVPGHRYLYRLGSAFYFRRGVPLALRPVFGKTAVSVSLGATSLAAARLKLAEHLREFDRLAGNIDAVVQSPVPSAQPSLPDQAAMNAGVRAWVSGAFLRSDPLVTQRSLGIDELDSFVKEQAGLEGHLKGQTKVGAPARLETEWIADHLCKSNGWDIDPASLHYRYLFNVVRQGQIEIAQRAGDLQALQPSPVRNTSLFGAEQYAADAVHRPASPPLHACLERFLARSGSRANDKTRNQSRQRLGVLLDALGRDRGIGTITKDDCRRLRDEVLLRLPANYTKRFRGMSVREAVAACAQTGGALLSSKTQSLMADQLKTFFQWALHEDLVTENPARVIEIAVQGDTIERRPFTPEQLVKIFDAPLYTGCVDDTRSYFKPGPNRPRRHRFWIPLVALFSGMRLNEICQLQKADVVAKGDAYFFDLTRYPSTDRSLKNPQSARLVPIHPELVEIGLLQAIADKRGSDWLFSDLDHDGHEGGSDAVSSWFGRFLTKVGLDADGLVFHSFRHTFRDGLREAGVDRERAFAIGGWKESGVGSSYGEGFSPSRLSEAMQRLHYPGLDLTHLRCA